MRKLIAAILLMGVGAAKAEEPLPTIHNIPCQTVCANSTGLVPITETRRIPSYPMSMSDQRVEGFVIYNVLVTEKGDIGEITPVTVVGPKDMVRAIARVVMDWKWKPATLEGKPVKIDTNISFLFRLPNEPVGARPPTARLYRRAAMFINEKKYAEALAALHEAQDQEKLNLYERGMLSNMAAQISLQQGDYFEAHRASEFALAHSASVLPSSVVRDLWRSRILASFALGDIVDGLDSFDKLKAMKGAAPDPAIAKYVEDMRAKADGLPVFGTSAKIPQPDDADSRVLGLYRRIFTFKDVKGALDRFVLNCKQQAIESKITDSAEWRIPANFSECSVRVHGAPGTTFKLIQANPSS